MQRRSNAAGDLFELVKVYIRRIRSKIELDPAEPSYVVNIRGFGYMPERRQGERAAA